MKIIKRIVLIFIILLILPLLVAIFVKKEFEYAAKITVDKPVEQVFDYIKHIQNQDHYGVWNLADPDMEKNFDGTDGTVGFVYSWNSDQFSVGSGKQEITAIQDGVSIDSNLYFMGDDSRPILSQMTTMPINKSQTEVSWQVSGRSPYPYNLMNLFFDMSPSLAHSLQNLKEILE